MVFPGSVVQSSGGNSKTLRLFGVNMECQLDELEPSRADGSSLWSHGFQQQQFNESQTYSSDGHHHMVGRSLLFKIVFTAKSKL